MGMVSAEQFEQALAQARTQALATLGDARAGLFGPRSISWEVGRETIVLLGGGAAALLQLAHPFVAHAVRQHSRVQRDVAGRFRRTFVRLLAMTFGDLDSALASARRVRAIHNRVGGTIDEGDKGDEPAGRFPPGSRYEANDAEAVRWVLATLLHTSMQVYSALVRPLTEDDRQRYYDGGKSLALLFGLLPEQMPADLAAFSRYYADMLGSDMLCVGTAARELSSHILTPPNVAVRPFYRFIRAYTAALLPERLRHGFGLRYGLRERALLFATLPVLRKSLRLLPPSARFFPGYLDAQRRLAGKAGIDAQSHRVAKRALRLLRPSFALHDLLE